MSRMEISIRANPVGPPLTMSAKLQAQNPGSLIDDPRGKTSIVILIHGFNVSYAEAAESYRKFLTSLNSTALSPLAIPIYEFHWPGDELSKIWSALSYATKIGIAKEGAELFCNFLEGVHGPNGGPIDVHFVAHSLGNRLLLALLDKAARLPNLIVRSATMMAAAVPVDMVAYMNPLYRACQVPLFTQVLHSKGDGVLTWSFPLGETSHGEAFLPRAVGTYGEPAGHWGETHAFDSFGHSDYWKLPGPPELVLNQLGIPTARLTPGAATPSRRTESRAPAS